MKRISNVVYHFVIVTFIINLSSSSELPKDVHATNSSLKFSSHDVSRTNQCGFAGDSDLYGLGIRIGYYAQAFAVWFATFFVIHEGRVLRSVNTLFMFAMLIGLLVLSSHPSKTYAVEAFLLLQIIITTWYIGTLNITGYNTQHWASSTAQIIFRELSTVIVVGYNFWFWWFGLDQLRPTPCGTFAFLVVRIDLYGRFRQAHKGLSIVTLIYDGVKKIYYVVFVLHRSSMRQISSPKFTTELKNKLRAQLRSTQASEKVNNTQSGNWRLEDIDFLKTHPILAFQDIRVPTRPGMPFALGARRPPSSPAPSSPDFNSTRSRHSQTLSTSPAPANNHGTTISFTDLYDADRYLDEVLASFKPNQIRQWQLPLFGNRTRIFFPNVILSARLLANITIQMSKRIARHDLNIRAAMTTISFIVSLRT